MSFRVAKIGVDGLPQSDADWIGQDNGPGQRSGIQALLDVSQVSIIAAPGGIERRPRP